MKIFIAALLLAGVIESQAQYVPSQIARNWQEFLPYMTFLNGPAGSCACEPNNEYLPPPAAGTTGPPGPPGAPGAPGAPGGKVPMVPLALLDLLVLLVWLV